ncbi:MULTISPECIES: acyl-CoA dehydrogenase family protein [unclassified Mycobacterium]|uniref:acyl-CoA dehydrogenase family protein n=1 Tax=unclassified Mycobacterium TaxID=2642494 RepID=UPI0029C76891|nr:MULTISPECIES: acyl-CoA dehydrogenase family protein [unclassified Mycobacterium]
MDDDDVDLDFLRRSAREFLAERGEKHSIQDVAAMDWIGLLVDEDLSGSGWRPVESCVIAEELGRAHDRTPWLGSAVAAAAMATAPDQLRERWLPALLKGAKVGGFAVAPSSGTQFPTVRVIDGDSVDILVIATTNGLELFEAAQELPRRPDRESLDVERTSWCIDVSAATGIQLGDAARASELRVVAQLLISADALGALSQAVERLTDYLRSRVAFGAPIASFQAIQHRLVDLVVLEAKARAIVMKAARTAAQGHGAEALAAAAHAFVAAKVTDAVDECMQLSGGIGFTWEYPLHHELRRASVDAWLFGTARASRALLAEVSGW